MTVQENLTMVAIQRFAREYSNNERFVSVKRTDCTMKLVTMSVRLRDITFVEIDHKSGLVKLFMVTIYDNTLIHRDVQEKYS